MRIFYVRQFLWDFVVGGLESMNLPIVLIRWGLVLANVARKLIRLVETHRSSWQLGTIKLSHLFTLVDLSQQKLLSLLHLKTIGPLAPKTARLLRLLHTKFLDYGDVDGILMRGLTVFELSRVFRCKNLTVFRCESMIVFSARCIWGLAVFGMTGSIVTMCDRYSSPSDLPTPSFKTVRHLIPKIYWTPHTQKQPDVWHL